VYRDRERVRLAPPDDELILASDSLVVLAEDQAAAAEGLQGVAHAPRRKVEAANRFASMRLASVGKLAVSVNRMSSLSPMTNLVNIGEKLTGLDLDGDGSFNDPNPSPDPEPYPSPKPQPVPYPSP